MKEPALHIGFIGLGEHQTRAHIKHLAQLAREFEPHAPLVFVGAFDPNPNAVADVKAACGVELQRFDSPEALLESKPLDAVFISSPDEFHMEQLRMALNKGLHVFCEKPIAVKEEDPLDLEELLTFAAHRRLVVSTCHPRRMDPPFLYIREQLPAWVEKLGPLKSFDFSFFYHEVTDEWKKNRSLLSDHFGHEIDILRFLVGNLPLQARKVADGYDFYEVQGHLSGGPSFRFYGSRALAESVYNETVRLDFTKGSLFFNLNTGEGIELHNFSTFRFPGIDYDERFYRVNLNFIEAVRGHGPSYLTPWDIVVNNATSVHLTEYGASPRPGPKEIFWNEDPEAIPMERPVLVRKRGFSNPFMAVRSLNYPTHVNRTTGSDGIGCGIMDKLSDIEGWAEVGGRSNRLDVLDMV